MPSYNFQQPEYSQDTPATPDARDRNYNRFGFSAVSNTPAGAPPSTARSVATSAAPPSSAFGSSQLDYGYDKEPQGPLNFNNSPAPANQYGGASSRAPYAAFGYPPQKPSGLNQEFRASEYSEYDETMNDNYNYDEPQQDRPGFNFEHFKSGQSLGDIDRMADELDGGRYGAQHDSMGGLQFEQSRPRKISFGMSDFEPARSIESVEDDFRKSVDDADSPFEFSRNAKDIYKQLGPATLQEDDDLILQTESLTLALYRAAMKMDRDADAQDQALTVLPCDLLSLWDRYNQETRPVQYEEYASAIGPPPGSSNFAHANFLANLLVRIHHPSFLGPSQPTRGSMPASQQGKLTPIPLELLEWMDEHHDPYPGQLDEIMRANPTPSAHKMFWATVINNLLRGRVAGVLEALERAGWEYAAHTDRVGAMGYTGKALDNVERVVGDMVNLLRQSPALRTDWDTTSSDWTLYRLKVSQGLENLKRFAEGKERDHFEQPAPFESSNFGGMFAKVPKAKSYSVIARKAESMVPWDVYQNLLAMYNLMLGDTTSIIANSQDWCEATIGLTVWWNHGKQDRRHISTMALMHREQHKPANHLKLLAEAFHLVIESKDFNNVSTISPSEVGVASIFEGDVESAIKIIGSYSAPVSAAVVELASIAGWLPLVVAPSFDIGVGLDQDDLNLLGLNGQGQQQRQQENIKDLTLITYADALTERRTLEMETEDGRKTVREGWQVAMEVLARLDSIERSEKEVGRLISDLNLEDGKTVEKIWRQLNELAMSKHAESVAERYANSLSEHTHKYGEALWYYALAHQREKVKEVLDLLISLSLLHSVAYPAESEMDDHLKRLITSPRTVLKEMIQLDHEAADILRQWLSGYATLRKFYQLRDAGVDVDNKEVSAASKTEAARALIMVITSSDDNIRGGLYDERRGAVVDVDFLLALLGEAMVFVDQPGSLSLSPYQIEILLKSIEDLETVGERVYGACDEFFKTVMASTPGLKGSNPMDLLKKSTSSMSGSSYSMVGSSMLASQFNKSIQSSGLLKENAKRGWDWRKGLTAGMTSKDVLRILRYGLAKDLAKTSVLQADGQLWN